MCLLGKGRHVREFLVAMAESNEDVKDSPGNMTLGVILLFWAFFLQLLSLFLK